MPQFKKISDDIIEETKTVHTQHSVSEIQKKIANLEANLEAREQERADSLVASREEQEEIERLKNILANNQ